MIKNSKFNNGRKFHSTYIIFRMTYLLLLLTFVRLTNHRVKRVKNDLPTTNRQANTIEHIAFMVKSLPLIITDSYRYYRYL